MSDNGMRPRRNQSLEDQVNLHTCFGSVVNVVDDLEFTGCVMKCRHCGHVFHDFKNYWNRDKRLLTWGETGLADYKTVLAFFFWEYRQMLIHKLAEEDLPPILEYLKTFKRFNRQLVPVTSTKAAA